MNTAQLLTLLTNYGKLKLQYNKLTDEIAEMYHTDCMDTGYFGKRETALEQFFNFSKDSSEYYDDFRCFCENETKSGKYCEKCDNVLQKIIERKKLRRSIGSTKGHITRLAIKLAKSEHTAESGVIDSMTVSFEE